VPDRYEDTPSGPPKARRLFVYNGGFVTRARERRILALAGWKLSYGLPSPGDCVGVWGQSPTAYRGEAIAKRHDAPLVRVEDAFLRSLFPGGKGEPPAGILIDERGVHFDPSKPSDLEVLLATHPLDDTVLLNRARAAMHRLKEAQISKYSAFDPAEEGPEPGYVLVIDQTRGDAAVTASKGNRNRFLEMLFVAQEEHPGARIVIKTHPETQQGMRKGFFEDGDLREGVTFCDAPISPWNLLDGAIGVYTLSSGMGFEAIIAGHKPRVFGQPFYAGWGLTIDEVPVTRRQRHLTRAQLFAGAMMLYPHWFDPFRDRLCEIEDVIEELSASAESWRSDRQGWLSSQMRLWKRRHMQAFFGCYRKVVFRDRSSPSDPRPRMVWAGKAAPDDQDVTRVEDGFLRSRGLGAELVPPVSLVLDDQGIYYDPTRPSRLETLIAARADLRPEQALRAEKLRRKIVSLGLSKYNLDAAQAQQRTETDRPRILVVGQVEDDASIKLGAGQIKTNAALLMAARDANPDAEIIYKPHPDVEAGLRTGQMTTDDAAKADHIATRTDIATLLQQVDALWTMTSLSGFEALLRGVHVVTTGAPFYAGWGLTEDLGDIPDRRKARITLDGLVHATLIDYPRYLDPITGRPCPVEVIVERLAEGKVAHPGTLNRLLSKVQGAFASYAHLWR
jgi:capsular polysaccharide export protein